MNLRPEIRVVKLKDLKPAPYNPRRIDKEALEGLTFSIGRFGNVQPIVWNETTGNIVGGHQRYLALRKHKVTEDHVVVRGRRFFTSGRKLVKTHQNVLVFVKGSAVEATKHLPAVRVPETEEEGEAA